MIVAVLALVVFVGVNWRLHDKGISMTSDYQCGLKEHKHTADCYKKVLICGKEETDGSEGHTHSLSLATKKAQLTSSLPMTEKPAKVTLVTVHGTVINMATGLPCLLLSA